MKKKSAIILSIISSISVTYTQREPSNRPPKEECDRYCFVNCDKYLEAGTGKAYQDEPPGIWLSSMVFNYQTRDANFTDCVTAQYSCDCDSRISIRNPLLWLALAGVALGMLIFIYYLCRRYHLYRAGNMFSRRRSLGGSRAPTVNTISTGHNGPFTDWFQGDDYEDKPPEYVPPPTYYDVSRNNSKENQVNSCDTKQT